MATNLRRVKIFNNVPEECREHIREMQDLIRAGQLGFAKDAFQSLLECLSDFAQAFAVSLGIDWKKTLMPSNGNSPGLAVDLGGDGVTLNDLGDDDLGPNNLQNYPVLAAATTIGSATTIVGSLNSNSDSTYLIEFYSNTVLDPSGYGEGENYLGFVNVTTNAVGDASFSFAPPAAVPAGKFITSTATRLDDETLEPVESSEFSRGIVVNPLGSDFDSDGDVDGGDLLAWQRGLGSTGSAATHAKGNADNDTDVDGNDLIVWRNQFGSAAAVAATADNSAAAAQIAALDSVYAAGGFFTEFSPRPTFRPLGKARWRLAAVRKA